MRVYMLSGFCAALVGVLLTGFSGQASLGMGDEYLLPSIAVVVVGGALITGGRGHYLGMLGGVLLLTALQTLLAGTTLPYATRAIIFGLVVLGAVIALRDRRDLMSRSDMHEPQTQPISHRAAASASWSPPAPPASAARSPTRLIAHGARVAHLRRRRTSALADFGTAHPERSAHQGRCRRRGRGRRACSTSVEAQLGGLDALVNNAGIAGPTGGVEEITPADWRRCIDVCLTGQFLCARRAVPMLKAAGGGAIVNMSSAAGRHGYAFRTPYSAAKFGVIGFTQSLAKELGPAQHPRQRHPARHRRGAAHGQASSAPAPRSSASPTRRWRSAISSRVSLRRMVTPARRRRDGRVPALAEPARNISGQSLGVDGNVETLVSDGA